MALSHQAQQVELDTGAKGLVVKIPGVHTVYMTFAFRAGAQYVPAELCQVPHLIEHLAFTHPGEFTSQEAFSRESTRRAASEDASTDEVHITYEASCSLYEYERILGMIGKVIAEPTFTEEHFQVEKSTVLEELHADLNRDARVFWQKANRLSGGGGCTDQEKIESLADTTVEHIRDFYQQSHVWENMRFVIAGDVSPEQVSRTIQGWKLNRGTRPDIRQDTLCTLTEPVLLEKPDYGTLDFSLSLFAPGTMSYEESAVWGFVHHLLFETYHSRVFGALRSKGTCYDIGATHMNMMDNYRELEVYGSSSREHIEETLAHAIDELRKLVDGAISDTEMAEVREYVLGMYERQLESPGEVASFYEGQYLLNESYITPEQAMDIVQSITPDMIAQYAREWIYKRTVRFGLIGDIDAAQATRLQAMANQLGVR